MRAWLQGQSNGRAIKPERALTRVLWTFIATLLIANAAMAAGVVTVASTTSIEQSGLWGHLLARFRQAHAVEVRVVPLGSGPALDMGRRGDADLLLVHEPDGEARFMAEGYGQRHATVMVNDFVIVGPASDPAGVRGLDAVAAMRRLVQQRAPFVSRGDRSGTHVAEQRLRALAGVGARDGSVRACGCGMGAALNMAAAMPAYLLVDRASWLASRRSGGLALLVEGDPRLVNRYSLIAVSQARHPGTNAEGARVLADWLLSAQGQGAIGAFRLGGDAPFRPAAGP